MPRLHRRSLQCTAKASSVSSCAVKDICDEVSLPDMWRHLLARNVSPIVGAFVLARRAASRLSAVESSG